MNYVANDQRVFARFAARVPVRFLNLDAHSEGGAETLDVSAKGLGLVTTERLQPHTSLEMWLHIPDQGQPLYTRGEVVWSQMIEPDRYRTGISLNKADLMGLSRVLRILGPH